jgi:hypothetical protein
MLSLLTPRQSDSVGGPIGSMREAKTVASYPNYDAAYLGKRLGAWNAQALEHNRYKTAGQFATRESEMVYLQNATKGYEAEAEECLKKEFKDWLSGVHEDNYNPKAYDNTKGGAIRRDMHGERMETWTPTWWGPHQLTYLPGVREYLREQAIVADQNSLDLNKLAHLGPQNVEEAWAYFKHWVKARPVGPEECLHPSPALPTDHIRPFRAGPTHMQHDTQYNAENPYWGGISNYGPVYAPSTAFMPTGFLTNLFGPPTPPQQQPPPPTPTPQQQPPPPTPTPQQQQPPTPQLFSPLPPTPQLFSPLPPTPQFGVTQQQTPPPQPPLRPQPTAEQVAQLMQRATGWRPTPPGGDTPGSIAARARFAAFKAAQNAPPPDPPVSAVVHAMLGASQQSSAEGDAAAEVVSDAALAAPAEVLSAISRTTAEDPDISSMSLMSLANLSPIEMADATGSMSAARRTGTRRISLTPVPLTNDQYLSDPAVTVTPTMVQRDDGRGVFASPASAATGSGGRNPFAGSMPLPPSTSAADSALFAQQMRARLEADAASLPPLAPLTAPRRSSRIPGMASVYSGAADLYNLARSTK